MADELRQELLSKARGIGATPKKVLINEGIEKWLPMVMGIAGPKFPAKVPPLPKGPQALDEVMEQLQKLHTGRGRPFGEPNKVTSPMEQLEELMPDYKIQPRNSFSTGQPLSREERLRGLIDSSAEEPSAMAWNRRVSKDPRVVQWFRDKFGYSGQHYDPVTGQVTKAPAGPPDLSNDALQQLLRFFAD